MHLVGGELSGIIMQLLCVATSPVTGNDDEWMALSKWEGSFGLGAEGLVTAFVGRASMENSCFTA